MSRRVKLLVTGAAVPLLATLAIAKKPGDSEKPGEGLKPVSQSYYLDGDVDSDPDYTPPPGICVEVGVKTWTWAPARLYLSGHVTEWVDGEQPLLGWWGHARVLKKNGRFDYDFDACPCRALTYGDVENLPLPPNPPRTPDDPCRYSLVVLEGIYDRKADTVDFRQAPAFLVDYTKHRDSSRVWEGSTSFEMQPAP